MKPRHALHVLPAIFLLSFVMLAPGDTPVINAPASDLIRGVDVSIEPSTLAEARTQIAVLKWYRAQLQRRVALLEAQIKQREKQPGEQAKPPQPQQPAGQDVPAEQTTHASPEAMMKDAPREVFGRDDWNAAGSAVASQWLRDNRVGHTVTIRAKVEKIETRNGGWVHLHSMPIRINYATYRFAARVQIPMEQLAKVQLGQSITFTATIKEATAGRAYQHLGKSYPNGITLVLDKGQLD